jgi:multidrug efflux pump subunit AcrB
VQVLDFQNQPVMTFAVSGETDTDTLKSFSNLLESRLKDLPNVEKVSVAYRNDPDVVIVLKPEILREKHLDIAAIAREIQTAISNYPAGNLSTDATTFALTQKTTARSVEELRALPLTLGGEILPLGEVATVREAPENNVSEAYYADARITGKRAVTFSVFKTDDADATETVQSILAASSKLNETYRNQFVIEAVFDGAKEIKKSFDQLFHDFTLTIFLVFTLLFVFFGLRQSIIATLAIPLTFLGTFLVMGASDISINFIALFSLLLALGILVDNAIVIISAMASYQRTKKFTPDETALLVWRDFRSVIFTTTITTVWAFLPLLLATGIIGEFIKPIPIVVSAALAISAAIALLIVIPMMAMLLKGDFPRRVIIAIYSIIALLIILLYLVIPAGSLKILLFVASLIILVLLLKLLRPLREKMRAYETSHFTNFFRGAHALSDRGLFSLDPLAHRYERFIQGVLISKSARRKTLAALIIFSICSYALVPLGYVVNEFFPQDNQDTAYISVELPKSTTLKQSKEEMLRLLDTFRSYEQARFVYAEIGASPPADNAPAVGNEFNKLLFTFALLPAADREATSGQIVADLNQKFGNYNKGTLSASQLAGGPPAGSDLQLKLLGDDLPTLQKYAKEVSAHLKEEPGVTNVAVSIVSGLLVYVPKEPAQENIRHRHAPPHLGQRSHPQK